MTESALVTGVSGFIGGHLARALAERGVRVVGLDHRPPASHLPLDDFLRAELGDADGVREAALAARADVVYHLGAQSSVVVAQREPVATVATNVLGAVALADAAAEAGAWRFVFFSTGGAMYGDPPRECVTEEDAGSPHSMYGATKLAAEQALRVLSDARGLPVSVLRPGNVYGPGQDGRGPSGVVAIFTERMLRDEPVTIYGDGSEVRDYVHVRDVVAAAILAAHEAPATCHVSSGVPVTNLEMFRVVARCAGYARPPIFEPARQGEIRGATLSPERARQAWGWTPTVDFEQGVAETVEWYRARVHAGTAA